MNRDLLRKHIADYLRNIKNQGQARAQKSIERRDRVTYYQEWTEDRPRAMTPDDVSEYISRLWAMLIWGNKQYVVDKLLADHGLETVREEIAHLIWAKEAIEARWDRFRANIKGMGPAMMSELLAHVHPE